MSALSKNLKRLRESKTKMSQREVADLLNVAPHTYGSWENGKTDIKGEYIPKIAEIFGVDIKELYEEDNIIKQNYGFNKCKSIGNGFVIILTNPEDVNKISDIIQSSLSKQ